MQHSEQGLFRRFRFSKTEDHSYFSIQLGRQNVALIN